MDETLVKTLDGLWIDEPVSHGPLSVFPLWGGTPAEQDLSLLSDALQAGTLRVEELHEGGSVPELRVINGGSSHVLILEGDDFIGEEGVLHAAAFAG